MREAKRHSRELIGSKQKAFNVAVIVLTLALLLPVPSVFAHGVQKYVNGFWFNGQTFEQKAVYVVEGVFRTRYDGTVDATIDLQGKFVIPPFAEAHNHHFGEEVGFAQRCKGPLRHKGGLTRIWILDNARVRSESPANRLLPRH